VGGGPRLLRKLLRRRFLKYLPHPDPPLHAGEGENLAQLRLDANQVREGEGLCRRKMF
jgi:hypothetical protein